MDYEYKEIYFKTQNMKPFFGFTRKFLPQFFIIFYIKQIKRDIPDLHLIEFSLRVRLLLNSY